MFKIEFYRLPNGNAPVEEFLDSLDVKMRVKAVNSLLLLEELGTRLYLLMDLLRRPRKHRREK